MLSVPPVFAPIFWDTGGTMRYAHGYENALRMKRRLTSLAVWIIMGSSVASGSVSFRRGEDNVSNLY